MKDNLTRQWRSGCLNLKDLRVKKTFTGLQHYCPALFYGMLQFVSGEFQMHSSVPFSPKTRHFCALLQVKEQKLQTLKCFVFFIEGCY